MKSYYITPLVGIVLVILAWPKLSPTAQVRAQIVPSTLADELTHESAMATTPRFCQLPPGPGTPRVYLPLVAKYTSGWETVFADSFEGAFPGPWQIDDYSGDGYVWGKRDCRPASGSNSAWAVGGGPGASLNCGSSYPDYTYGWMTYGPFNLAEAETAAVAFRLWQSTANPQQDQVCWYASKDNVAFGGYCQTVNTECARPVFDLSSVPGMGNLIGEPQVWVAFTFYSDPSSNQAEGAYLDDVTILRCRTLEGCRGGPTAAAPENARANTVQRPEK